ncbi:MAG: virulence protein SciE type [Gammaproteobacteria bacterium]|nr:virulence protein SciE type [Gammaproteobacteria bacterium]MBI5615181.1 virulence protein SciE type [Gammaproteobacteria bacterium]
MAGPVPAELIREGDFAGALAAAKDLVRKQPATANHRVLLFQLFAVGGEWDKALTQLEVVSELDASALPMVQTYREVLRCEVLRAEVFAGRRSPMLLGEPQQWIAWQLEALRLTAQANHAEADRLRARVFEEVAAVAGTIDGQAFEWIADADARIGPALEAIVNGRYYWVPFDRIRSVDFEAPADLRDLVWLPAQFTWSNGGEAVGFVPSRYPGSEKHEDSRVMFSRLTVWQEPAPETFVGFGQRLFATDAGEFALLDTRRIELETAIDATDTAG